MTHKARILSAVMLTFLTAQTAYAIADWRPVDGLSEERAEQMTVAAIRNHLTVDEDGQVCGVDEVWGLERGRDLKPDRPERGEIIAVTGYAKGPDLKCQRDLTYDCRVVFYRSPRTAEWAVEYTDCDPVSPEHAD